MTEADAVTLNAIEKTTGFVVGIGTTIDDDSVAWMKWGEHFLELDPVSSSPCYFPSERATLFSKTGVNELLMVDAMEPAGKKATAKGHLQAVLFFRSCGRGLLGQGAINGLSINRGNGGNVVRRFKPTLDLERVEAEFDEFRDLIDSGEILGGEKVGTIPEVTGLAVDFEGVGHAAGLSALPAVGAAATEDFAGEALA